MSEKTIKIMELRDKIRNVTMERIARARISEGLDTKAFPEIMVDNWTDLVQGIAEFVAGKKTMDEFLLNDAHDFFATMGLHHAKDHALKLRDDLVKALKPPLLGVDIPALVSCLTLPTHAEQVACIEQVSIHE